jgi:2-hydroxy fatty acid dioxygenase
MQTICWIAQFIGHGVAEKRAPALLDNLIGAIVLAPFFVHLEILFAVGYRPGMHKRLVNDIGKEIARIKKIEGDKRRAKAQ